MCKINQKEFWKQVFCYLVKHCSATNEREISNFESMILDSNDVVDSSALLLLKILKDFFQKVVELNTYFKT